MLRNLRFRAGYISYPDLALTPRRPAAYTCGPVPATDAPIVALESCRALYALAPQVRPRRRRCATIPPPWGLLTLGLLVLLPGDALYRALFPALLSAGACPPGPGERLFLRVL